MTQASAQARRSKRSHTAEGAAAVRAAGHHDPDPVVRNPDHLAAKFLGPVLWLRACWAPMRPVTRWWVERILPGFYRFVTARTKHFDAILLAEVAGGVNQVVILGAGADSRAYRFAKELGGVTIVEIDHPLTSAWKQKRVNVLFPVPPKQVVYAGVDFDHESLDQALDRVGVKRNEPTLFLFEGVTHYLSAAAIDATLAVVASFTPGSSVVFDYFYAEAFHDPQTYPDAAKYLAYTAKHAEPLVFGIGKERIATFLAERSLELSTLAGPRELSTLYVGGDPRILRFSPIAHARVPV